MAKSNILCARSIGWFAVAVAFAAALLCAGCGGNASSAPSEAASAEASSASASASSESAAEQEVLVLGTDDGKSYNCVFVNETGATITNLAVVPVASEGAQVTYLMTAGQSVPDGDSVSVFAEPVDDSSVFNVMISMQDANFTLHNLDFATLKEATVHIEGDVAYIEAEVDGNVVSTLQDEMAAAEAEAAAVEAEAAAAEAAAAEAAAAEQASTYVPPAAPAAPAQSGDSCVGDVVLR